MVPEHLQRYITSNNIRGEHLAKALEMMDSLFHVGFGPSHCAWWLQWDSDVGERVFADCFFMPGVCRLLWKDKGSAEAEAKVLGLCDQAEVDGCFPFRWRE